MYRPNYHRATRQAYRVLLAAKIDRLPVDVDAICERCHDTTLVSSRTARELMGDDFDPFFDGPSRTALTIRRWRAGRAYHTIIWNTEEMSHGSAQYRYAIAHELGHVLLRHPGGRHPAAEAEADLYAQHLLCPRPVLDVLQPDALEIAQLFGVSMSLARSVRAAMRQENRYVDEDMWSGIFAAFGLDERRTVTTHLTPAARVAMDVSRRRLYAAQSR